MHTCIRKNMGDTYNACTHVLYLQITISTQMAAAIVYNQKDFIFLVSDIQIFFCSKIRSKVVVFYYNNIYVTYCRQTIFNGQGINNLPWANRLTRGTKLLSKSSAEWSAHIFRRDSTALSRTTVSSTVAKLSRGGNKQWTCSEPPTSGVKLASCSASASKTSSSSYMVSVKNGISSLLVRSTPRASAIVDNFVMEFNRSYKWKNNKLKKWWPLNTRQQGW